MARNDYWGVLGKPMFETPTLYTPKFPHRSPQAKGGQMSAMDFISGRGDPSQPGPGPDPGSLADAGAGGGAGPADLAAALGLGPGGPPGPGPAGPDLGGPAGMGGPGGESEPIQAVKAMIDAGKHYVDVEPDQEDVLQMHKILTQLQQLVAKDQHDQEQLGSGQVTPRTLRKTGILA